MPRSAAEPAPRLADLTTLRIGGAPNHLVRCATQAELIDAARGVWSSGDEWLLLGGGSNTVASDESFEGTVIRIDTHGIERLADAAATASDDPFRVVLRVQAGENWDELVAHTVAQGWSGIEALSGIPGRAGAAPVQNIGAYGQELSDSLLAIEFLDHDTHDVRRMEAAELELGYRTSVLKQGLLGVVLAIELELHDSAAEALHVAGNPLLTTPPLSTPIGYGQLASALGVEQGARVPITTVRDAVLSVRASKGMVLDASDPDTQSAGSFFTNPIVSESVARSLPSDAPRWPITPIAPDVVVPIEAEPQTPWEAAQQSMAAVERPEQVPILVKLSAAWLIEQAGIRRGFRLGDSNAAISSKHTLAITNQGGASADEIAQLARYVQGRVQSEFGVLLRPEPVLVGLEL